MIGFYDYTVIMTYISVVSSMIGIFCAVTDHISAAVCCLAFSGLCDMFDGKIARTKKNRTEEEKCFGIQIDSLADIVCFGILPIVLGFKLGMCHIYGIAILSLRSAGNISAVMKQPKILSGTSHHIHVCGPAASICGIPAFSGV